MKVSQTLSLRRMLLAGTTLAAASAMVIHDTYCPGAAGAGTGRRPAEHPRHLRRRRRPDEHQRLTHGLVGYKNAEHRPDRQGRHDVHRLLRREQLHGGPLVLHHRPDAQAHRPVEGRHPGRAGRPAGARHHHRPGAQAARLCDRAVRQEPPRRPDEYLPTAHGFDEFFGNLYHLNAEEEPERPYWPKDDTAYVKANSPRGVLQTSADGKIEDTGPLTKKAHGDDRRRNHRRCIDFMSGRCEPASRSSPG